MSHATTTGAERRHPLLFTPEEAAAYLHLDCVGTLVTVERDHKLKAFPVGRQKLYWKKDLDLVAYLMVGEIPPPDLRRKPTLTYGKESA